MRQEIDDGLISWLENPNVEDEVTRSMEARANLWSDLRDGFFIHGEVLTREATRITTLGHNLHRKTDGYLL